MDPQPTPRAIWRFLWHSYGQAFHGRGVPTLLALILANWPAVSLFILSIVLACYLRSSDDKQGATVMVAILIPITVFLLAVIAWLTQIVWITAKAAAPFVRGNDPKIEDHGERAQAERKNVNDIVPLLNGLIGFLKTYDPDRDPEADNPGPNHKGYLVWQQRDVFDGSVRPVARANDADLLRNRDLSDYPKLYTELIDALNHLIFARNCNPEFMKTTWQAARDAALVKAVELQKYLENRL